MGNLCASRKQRFPVFSSDLTSPLSSPNTQNAFTNTPQVELESLPPSVGSDTQSPPSLPKPDWRNFVLSKLENKVIIKTPNTIQGQAFSIEDCSNSTIFLFDHTASLTIDNCHNCTILVGPCESSVFIRDCEACKFMICAQQLRFRNCQHIDAAVFVAASQPVIENSTQMKFNGWPVNYFELQSQLDKAKLCAWNTEWENVYDFTSSNNWGKLPFEQTNINYFFNQEILNDARLKEIQFTQTTQDNFVIPHTIGRSSAGVFVAIGASTIGDADKIARLLIKVVERELMRSKMRENYSKGSNWGIDTRVVIGCEFEGSEEIRQILGLNNEFKGKVYVEGSEISSRLFFELVPI